MKILVAVFVALIAMPGAFAEESAGVVSRVSCDDIQAQISELSAIEEPDEDTIDELTELKSDYRRSCMKSAKGRRAAAASRVIINEVVEEEQDEVADEEVSEETSEEAVSEEVSAPLEEELTPEQVLANLDAGLCADGTKPNRFGCCTGEVFKDLGDTVFACCPEDGGDCFPPLK